MTKKANLRLMVVVILSILTFSASAFAGTYSGGSGTEADPYLISTAADMNAIGADANDWSSHFLLVNDINLAGYTGTEFNIIGYYIIRPLHAPIEVPFSGVFDGNDNVIYSFTYSSNERDNVGLFGFVDDANAEIRNLTLIAPDVNAATKDDVGPLIGVLNAGHVLNCKVEGGSIYGRNNIGGLVGHVISPSGRITNCSSSSVVSGSGGIGGLVGCNTARLIPGGGGIITKCFASGAVNGDSFIGGLVGMNCRLVSDCYASGDVSGSDDTGGLVGFNYWGTISRSYSTGSVEGHDKTGGLVGWNSGGTISDCYAAGDVDGVNQTGGLVGRYNDSIVFGMISNCYAAGDVNGTSDTGALVGHDGSNSYVNCSYIKCFWDSDVNPDVNGIGNRNDPNVTSKLTAEMQTKGTFTDAGWDFTTPIWIIRDGLDYPRLWWMVIYVDDDAQPNGDGTSWTSAYNYLQDALSAASSGYEIRVAQGTYIPDRNSADPNGSGDRNATFQLKNGVAIIGGYAGFGEPDPNIRNVETYETVLSGDLDGDDVDVAEPCDLLFEPTRGENSYHVVTTVGTDNTFILDGFTIIGGNANDSSVYDRGSGMLNSHSNSTLTSCTFTKNSASHFGGGMHNYYSNPTLINCTFTENYAGYGGGMDNWSGSPILSNCTFIGNSAEYNGGGMSSWCYSNLILSNCTFSQNSTGVFGGGLSNADSNSTLANCTFRKNTADGGGGGMYSNDSNSALTNCIFTANSGSTSGGMYNRRSNSTLTNCIFTGNFSYPWGGGGMDNYDHSNSILTNCTFMGNYAQDGGSAISNGWYSNSMLTNCIVWENITPDGNQIENEDGSTTAFTYSDVQGGWPGENNIDSDPLFVNPGYWDSSSNPINPNNDYWIDGDYYLMWRSPCIDAGDPNYIPEPNETDLDGNPRIINEIIDIGAYEAPLGPLDLLTELSEHVDAMNLQKGIANSLQAKLNTAIHLLEDANENNDITAINSLQAFINAVEAQYGKKIQGADADILIAAAQEILKLLNGE